MPSPLPSRRLVAGAAAIALVAAACTDDGASPPTPAPATTTTTAPPARLDDGILRIGVLLPESGAGAAIGQPMIDAVVAAGDAINDAGGVLGEPVDVITGHDEGENAATARDAIASLIEEQVDAVVGPASSSVALATVPDLLDAGIVTCSPTATALALDGLPDRQLFVRTAPSDSLQAIAIATEAEQTGALTAAVVYLNDAYGRPLAEATMDALRDRGITVQEPISFVADDAEDDSLVDEATALADSDAGVFVVIADAEHGARMLSSLGEVTGAVTGESQPSIFVNDAMRHPPSPQQIAQLAPDVRKRIIGLSPSPSSGLPDEPPGPFATNAYDCVNLIALAAMRAESDNPEKIVAEIPSVSDGGQACSSFAECVDLMSRVPNIDYDGPGGRVQLGADGDPASYRFDKWGFDEQGRDIPLTTAPIAVNR